MHTRLLDAPSQTREPKKRILGFEVTYRRALFLSFALGFFIRLIPEVLAFPHPIGYDSVHYGASLKSGVIWSHWSDFFSTWLIYALTIPVYNAVRGDPFLVIKLVGPLLYGLSACGIFWFSREGLKWDARRSLMAAAFFVVQLAAFRISWDLLRNTFGMAILLFALPFLLRLESGRDFVWFMFLSVLVVFGHELAAIVMVATVFGAMLNELLRRNRAGLLKISVAASPSLILFLASIYLKVFPPIVDVQSNMINVIQPLHRPAGLFFLANYFVGSTTGFYSSYFDLALTVLGYFTLLYLLALPLVFVGFFRNKALDFWTFTVVCTSFSCLVVPFIAFDWWDRWMLLLVYPITFYAANGLMKVFRSVKGMVHPTVGLLKWIGVSRKTSVGLFSCMILLTSVYLGATLTSDSTKLFSEPMMTRFFSLAPAVPFQDIDDTIRVLEWVEERLDERSCVLVHATILEWTRFSLDKNRNIIIYIVDVENAVSVAASQGYNSFYLVWWGTDVRGYWFTVPSSFEPAFRSGRMVAYQHSG